MFQIIRTNPRMTILAGIIGYCIQAMVYNFFPLLYTVFQEEFEVSIGKIAFLTTINFTTQIVSGLYAGQLADRIGYRRCSVLMEIIILCGMLFLTVTTRSAVNPYLFAMIGTGIMGLGAGIQEALVPAIIQSCPNKNKEATMSLVNAFYAFGAMAIVLLSTAFFRAFGTALWRILTGIWMLLPLLNLLLFLVVPMYSMNDDVESAADTKPPSVRQFLSLRVYQLLLIVIFCAGACDVGYSQWISSFMETEIRLSKTTGDLLGPTLFTMCSGIGRLGYAFVANRLNLERCMKINMLLCIAGFLLTAVSPTPLFAVAGCMLSGLGESILYPGAVSLTTRKLDRSSTQAITLLTVSGSVGSTVMSTLVGTIADNAAQGLRAGYIGLAMAPVIGLAALFLVKFDKKKEAD